MNKVKPVYLLIIAVLVIYVFKFSLLNRNLDSIYDEGFLFLSLQAAKEGVIDGTTQWAVLVNYLLSEKQTANILNLRHVSFTLNIVTILLFLFSSYWFLKNKKIINDVENALKYSLLILLIGTITTGSIIVHYNQLQQFFLIGILSLFLISLTLQNRLIFIPYLFIGVLSFLAILTILPSGVLILLCIMVMLWLNNSLNTKQKIISTTAVLSGAILATLYFHYFIVDLGLIYEKMALSAETITKLNRGYDIQSFILKLLLYFRDYYIHTSAFLGILLISYFTRKHGLRLIAYTAIFVSLVVFKLYFKNPGLPHSTLLSFPIIGVIVLIIANSTSIKFNEILHYKVIVLIFLFFFPLISSMGTNTPLAGKMNNFIIPWGLLFVLLSATDGLKKHYHKEITFFFWLMMLVIIYPSLISAYSNFTTQRKTNAYFTAEKPISNIGLTTKQKEYFDNVYAIMAKYGYGKGDYIFATQLDHMTIVAFEGKPVGTFFQPMDYLAVHDKALLKKPDFIFLTDYDLSLISESLGTQDWGFPDDFDEYFVGTPETYITSYPTERKLFCRKNRIITN